MIRPCTIHARTLRSYLHICSIALLLAGTAAAQATAPFPADPAAWAGVERALGRTGKLQDGVYKVSFPRTDLHVRLGNTELLAGAALGSWMAFRTDGNSGAAVTDGDLVLLSSEVGPVLDALQQNGIEVTGIHNHLTGEQPEIIYVHFFGKGKAADLAAALKKALDTTRTPTTRPAAPPAASFDSANQKTIETALGKAGSVNGSVLAFAFPRSHRISMHEAQLPPSMGMATAINFQSSPQGVAATGDFVLRENEVNPVVKALRAAGIQVTAMHNHLLDDEPHMYFVHFWAEGPAAQVARGLRQALDLTAAATK